VHLTLLSAPQLGLWLIEGAFENDRVKRSIAQLFELAQPVSEAELARAKELGELHTYRPQLK
jgi:hypothetical protein